VFIQPKFHVGDLVRMAPPIQLQLFSRKGGVGINTIGIVKEVIRRESEFETFEFNYVIFMKGRELLFYEYEIERLKIKTPTQE
jgi:hypothetical protein